MYKGMARNRLAKVWFTACQIPRPAARQCHGVLKNQQMYVQNALPWATSGQTSFQGLKIRKLCLGTFYPVPEIIHQGRRRLFHTTSPRHVLPFWILIKPLAKVGSIVTGRTLRLWWKKLPNEEKQKWSTKLSISRHKIAATVLVLLAAGGIYYRTHIQEAPITKRRRFIAFSPEQFRKIVEFEYEAQMESVKDILVKASNPAYSNVSRVVRNIVSANQDLDLMRSQTWTLILVDSKEKNAFVLPTGHIFVYTGLLNMVQNYDQLAVVIGHEMAHAVLSHGAERVSMMQLVDFGVILVMAAIWFFMPTDGIAVVTQWFYNKVVKLLLQLPYDRMMETEADEVGLQLISKACYDVRESSNFWDLMQLVEKNEDDLVDIPQWLSTHPSNENRAQSLEKLIPEAISIRDFCNCPRLPPKDPRITMKTLKAITSEPEGIKEKKEQASTPPHQLTPYPQGVTVK